MSHDMTGQDTLTCQIRKLTHNTELRNIVSNMCVRATRVCSTYI